MSVSTLLADARSYAGGLVTDAEAALQSAISAVELGGFTQLSYEGVALPAAPAIPDALVAPTFEDVTLELPAEPDAALLFQDISPIEPGAVPLLTAVAPTLTMPTKPSALAEFQVTAPAINTSFDFPEPPSVLLNPLVDAPVLTERDEPAKPQTLLPAFTAQAPTDLPVAPADIEQSMADAYAAMGPSTIAMLDGYVDAMIDKFNPNYHTAMTALEAQLARYLAGGTGIDAPTENAYYERARDKVDAEIRRVPEAAYADAADKGFTLPTGMLLSAISTARQAGADNLARSAREIVVLAHEAEQKNLQFAVTTSANLRVTVLNSALSYHQNLITINGQALKYAEMTVSAIVEVYNTAVKAFTAKLDLYRAEASVFETRLKSALAGIELYRIEIQALEALTQIDRAKVEVYKARIDALMVYANVYRAQIEAVQGRASLEKLKLDLFGSQVQAFTSHVQAKNAEWQGYTAALGGEEAKARMFGAQVQGFLGQMQGWKGNIEGQVEVVRAAALTNGARADQHRATLANYSAVVEARGSVARTKLENQRQGVISFQAQAQAQESNARLGFEYYRSTGEISIKNAALSIEAIVKSAEMTRMYTNSIAQLSTANAQIHSSVAAASLSGMNTLASQSLEE